MSHMPRFVQSSLEFAGEFHTRLEAELLKERSLQGLHSLLKIQGQSADVSAYTNRLEHELSILINKHFCGYFLIVADYVNWAKKTGIAVGPGRGSGPCSLVAFALGITTIDPIQHQLPFERFINPERNIPPDFDLDFCDQRRAEVVHYIQCKYGADRVAQISADTDTPLPSRLIISDQPLTNSVQIYSNPDSGFPAAQITAAQLSDSGLVKFNVINQKALTIIQHTIQSIGHSTDAFDINRIPLDDADAYQLLGEGAKSYLTLLDDIHYETTLKQVKPTSFKHLIASIALCQPHLRHCVPIYAGRKQHTGPMTHYHPALATITAQSYGLIIYQEQLMQICQKLAAFTLAQADSFRRALKNGDQQTTQTYRESFVQGAFNFGFTLPEAQDMYDHLATAGLHCFNKAHAIAYATIAYQSAWLQAHYPAEFNTAKQQYLQL